MIKAAIVGLGPVAITVASRLQKLGQSVLLSQSNKFSLKDRSKLLQSQGLRVEGLESRAELQEWNDQVKGDVLSLEQSVVPETEYLFLAVPHTSYLEVLKKVDLSKFTNVVLLNPGLGSSQQVMRLLGHNRVLTFSNFLQQLNFLKVKLL